VSPKVKVVHGAMYASDRKVPPEPPPCSCRDEGEARETQALGPGLIACGPAEEAVPVGRITGTPLGPMCVARHDQEARPFGSRAHR
jgi:hypothetical protein